MPVDPKKEQLVAHAEVCYGMNDTELDAAIASLDDEWESVVEDGFFRRIQPEDLRAAADLLESIQWLARAGGGHKSAAEVRAAALANELPAVTEIVLWDQAEVIRDDAQLATGDSGK